MSTEVKVGQVWKDKDKRRNTVIEILSNANGEVVGLVVGTEQERVYTADRLIKRWELVQDRAEIPLLKIVDEIEEWAKTDPEIAKMVTSIENVEDVIFEWDGKGSIRTLAEHAHIHVKGECVKNRDEVPCDTPKVKRAVWVGPPVEAEIDQELSDILSKSEHMTREQWLERAVQVLTDEVFAPQRIEVPKVRVSVGWPGGRGPKKNIIGQCFAATTTGDKVAQIFISPVLEDAYGVVETMAHELIHAIAVDEDGVSAGHKGEFIRIAKLIGFTKPWRSTPATDEFRVQLQAIANMLGEYPHSAIRQTERPKVQKTYYLKAVCSEDPEYFLRITQTKIDDFGLPLCPCHEQEMEIEEK